MFSVLFVSLLSQLISNTAKNITHDIVLNEDNIDYITQTMGFSLCLIIAISSLLK